MSVDYGHCNYFFEKIINVRSIDQMRKRYDFKIKGVKVLRAMKSQSCQNPYNPDFDAYIYRLYRTAISTNTNQSMSNFLVFLV